jgi:hypothetical protein
MEVLNNVIFYKVHILIVILRKRQIKEIMHNGKYPEAVDDADRRRRKVHVFKFLSS